MFKSIIGISTASLIILAYTLSPANVDLSNQLLEPNTTNYNHYSPYNLILNDVDLAILGNRSLRDLFETSNLVINNTFALGTSNWGKGGNTVISQSNQYATISTVSGANLRQLYTSSSTLHYAIINILSVSGSTGRIAFNLFNSSYNSLAQGLIVSSGLQSFLFNSNGDITRLSIDQNQTGDKIFTFTDIRLYNLNALSLTNLTKQTLDTLFSYYQMYKNGLASSSGLFDVGSSRFYVNDEMECLYDVSMLGVPDDYDFDDITEWLLKPYYNFSYDSSLALGHALIPDFFDILTLPNNFVCIINKFDVFNWLGLSCLPDNTGGGARGR